MSEDIETRCKAAHAWYCQLVKMRFDYRYAERLWWQALSSHGAKAIARAAKYVLRQIEEHGWDRNAALPTNFLQPDRLADYIATSTPPREFRLTDEEASLASDFSTLIGETVKTLKDATPLPPPDDWQSRLLSLYPAADKYSSWHQLPPYIQTEIRNHFTRPALPDQASPTN